ncbi:MAG: hypothetical protein GY880_08330 [Planctomycetaceae bacterium]|nr:hypothetical protein [Planctomycetaceae bacterium]
MVPFIPGKKSVGQACHHDRHYESWLQPDGQGHSHRGRLVPDGEHVAVHRVALRQARQGDRVAQDHAAGEGVLQEDQSQQLSYSEEASFRDGQWQVPFPLVERGFFEGGQRSHHVCLRVREGPESAGHSAGIHHDVIGAGGT